MTSGKDQFAFIAWQAGIAILLTLSMPCPAGAVAPGTPAYAFREEGRHYTFRSQFAVAASPERVLAILYPVRNLRRYSSREGSVDLIDEGPGWQLVRLTHTTLFWTFSAVVRREIACAGHCIEFHMLRASRTGLPIPMPTSSGGEYLVEASDGGTLVTFTQSVEAPDTILLGPWMAWAKSHAIAFSRDLESYVRLKLN